MSRTIEIGLRPISGSEVINDSLWLLIRTSDVTLLGVTKVILHEFNAYALSISSTIDIIGFDVDTELKTVALRHPQP